MGARSRNKGKRGEQEVVFLARSYGLDARRTWETASSSDPLARRCDVLLAGHPAQVKVAANGFRGLYAALEGVEMAFLRSDRRGWLVALRADDYLRLLASEAR
jgi:hypothetical protein